MPRSGSDSIKFFRRSDFLLILAFLLAAALAFGFMMIRKKEGRTVRVTVDGRLFGLYALDRDREVRICPGENEEQSSESPSWENILVIKDGQAQMIKADCPDLICVKHKPVSHVGESIVCLPHKVLVEVTGEEEKGDKKFDVIVE